MPERALRLRMATVGDLPAVEVLLSANALPLAGVAEAIPDFVVAETPDGVVGIAGLEIRGEHALLRSVAVDTAWRNRGIGRTLVDEVIAKATARGLSALYLLTTTAEHYFPSFGFAPVTRDTVPTEIAATTEFRDVCPASAVVMSRSLGADRAPAATQR